MADNEDDTDSKEDVKNDEKENDKHEKDDEDGNENEEDDDEEEEQEEKKEEAIPHPKRYSDEIYGEEFGGEGGFYPPPSNLGLFMRPIDSTIVEPIFEETQAPEDVEPIKAESEQSWEGEEKGESMIGEVEEETTTTKAGPEKISLESITSFEYGARFSEYFFKPQEKTLSDIQFEVDYREVVEEKLKKIMRPPEPEEEREKRIEDRKPIEKKKVLITELDVSHLYPTPKVVESEESFAFDEDDDGDKGQRGIQTDADIVQHIIDVLRESLRYDPESIFVKNLKDSIQKVKAVIEETVTTARKGLPVNIPQKVNESLPNFKTNLKNILIIRMKEKLEKAESQAEAEEEGKEEEGKPAEGEKMIRIRAKRYSKARPTRRIEESEQLERVPEEMAEDKEKEKLIKVERETEKEEPSKPRTEEEEGEEEEEEGEIEELIPYEKINWLEYLTESERKLSIDPVLRAEMEQYLAKRREEIIQEQKIQAQKRHRKEQYKKVTDPQEMLRILNLNVTMKFILNTGDVYTCAYRYFMPFKEIKQDISGIFKVPPDVLIIYRDEVEVKDDQTAYDLVPEIEPFDSVTFRLLTLDNDRWPLKSDHLDLPVPDIITCTVETGKDHNGVAEYKDVVVEIENRAIKKPFVGGYRDCATGIEYHHAFSQSAPHPPKLPWDKRVSRDTQTAFIDQKQIDTTNDKSTQMARRDYYISTEEDKIITAKPYIDYDTWYKQRDIEGKVKTIQRYVRAMIIRRFLKQMSEEYRKRHCWEVKQEEKRLLERENRIKMDIINMTYPKTKAHFDMLYALVEKWRKAQVERITKLKTEAPKKAELCSVLEKEIKLLEAIEVHRIAVRKEQKRIKALNFMEKVSKPITWTGFRGLTVKMDTLKTQRARELKELYQSLSRHELSHHERIELLITLKYALRVHGTRLTDELTDLVNQECEMLIRGAKAKDLEYLRQRIEHLFTEYFKDPYFNPEAAKYDPMFNKRPLKHNILFCKMCHQMKLLEEFSATTRDRSVNVCSSCQWIHNISVPRIDLNPYRYILKTVRRDEQKRNCYSSCAFILQDEDMRFLVQNIWRNRSAVSENENLIDLRMPRWDKDKDWTPWNCILLTEQEAKAHLKTDPADNYEPQLLGEIISKHELAKRHFQQLFSTATRIRDSGKWANTVDIKEYVPPPITADIWDIKPHECLKIKKNGAFYKVHETMRKRDGYVQTI